MNTSTATQSPVLPAVGSAATYGIGADRYAYIVTRTAGTTVVYAARADKLEGENGTYVLLPVGNEKKFTRRAGDTFRPVGSNCGYLSFGKATDYMDPSF